MLSKRENFLQTIRGGNPDRYVNQYEFFSFLLCMPLTDDTLDEKGRYVDEWGVTWQVEGQPGDFPLLDPEHLVVSDIENWKDQLKVPTGYDDPAVWEDLAEQAEAVDTNEMFRGAVVVSGVFERFHHLCGMTDGLMALYEYPEEAAELLECITDVELELAEGICKYLKPELLFHHDDWGTDSSTFMSPDMFREFIKPCYEKIYGYYRDHGVDIIIHHSDSYAETLIPDMIDLGVDVWQGALKNSNDLPALIDKYGGKISFMGGIDDQVVDVDNWTPESVRQEVFDSIDELKDGGFFIPCLTQGGPFSLYDGVYDEVTKAIDEKSSIDFS